MTDTPDLDPAAAAIIASGEPVVLLTGPIAGTVTLADGTVVDVTPDALELADPLLAYAIADAIGKRHEAEGTHPLAGSDFIHADTPASNPTTQEL